MPLLPARDTLESQNRRSFPLSGRFYWRHLTVRQGSAVAASRLQHWHAALTRRLGRRMGVAVTISACVHLTAVAVLGLFEITAQAPSEMPEISATIAEDTAVDVPLERLALRLEVTGDTIEGGSSFDTPETVIATGGGPPVSPETAFIGPGTANGVATGEGMALNEHIAPLGGGGGGSRGSGEGNGIGNGTGDGTGASFFGLTAQGQKFVFVVDASSSMRRPSRGPERTLFNRVKLEIMESIRRLSPEQRFYIVFFNDGYYPMPATSLVAATEESQARYLQWMSDVPSGGETDPEAAMQLALQLRPDVIYLLSDGEFRYGLVKRIAAMNRSGVSVHTVCYGGTEDNNVSLRQIAEQNSGTYHFVPLPALPQETAARTPDDSAATP
ncbi:MAG: VWA domain-containing protein [Planctomycetaceae bacterium]|nr:VWA domain-containing protein [Planctomycetaceae bacterium]